MGRNIAHTNERLAQRRYYEEACDEEFEIRRPRGCGKLYELLIAHKCQVAFNLLPRKLLGSRVLEVCCGSGIVSEALTHSGASVTGIDFSVGAIAGARRRARPYRFGAQFVPADTEKLLFADQAFDIVAVHDGLHHLENPRAAVAEMARVASCAVLILEPARAFLTRVAVALDIAEDVEEAGNEVRRLDAREFAGWLREEGFGSAAWRRTLMYYPHKPSAWFRWFDRRPLFLAFRAGFWIANRLIGRWGNKLALGASRTARRRAE